MHHVPLLKFSRARRASESQLPVALTQTPRAQTHLNSFRQSSLRCGGATAQLAQLLCIHVFDVSIRIQHVVMRSVERLDLTLEPPKDCRIKVFGRCALKGKEADLGWG